MRRRIVLVFAGAALVLMSACSKEEPPQVEAGGCISVEGKAIEAVDCKSGKADRVLVDRIAEGYPCRDDLVSINIQQTLNGKPVGFGQNWCTTSPGKLTDVHKERIKKQKAEDAN